MRHADGVLRLIPCEACEGTGDRDGRIAQMIDQCPNDDNFIGGIPDTCPVCKGRRVVSWPELDAYRKKRDQEWEESGFGKIMAARAERDIQRLLREETIREMGKDCYEREC
jgi:hypothetical protein